jgi:hypothetical protein
MLDSSFFTGEAAVSSRLAFSDTLRKRLPLPYAINVPFGVVSTPSCKRANRARKYACDRRVGRFTVPAGRQCQRPVTANCGFGPMTAELMRSLDVERVQSFRDVTARAIMESLPGARGTM